MKRIERYLLPACLAVQAALLFYRLDLLPIWGDEQFTLDTSPQPLAQIAAIVRGDIHPPLYYFLVHYWLALPWTAAAIVKARAFSGVWALATTILQIRLWGRHWPYLLLWTLSPCLILYARMARSYTMQMFLASLALYFGAQLLRNPKSRTAIFLYTISAALLFYTHYLPAIAIAAAVETALLYRALRKQDAWMAALASPAILLILYAPWLMSLGGAVERVAGAAPYNLTANPFLEQAMRLAYLALSFTIGETAPLWVILCAAAAGVAALFTRKEKPHCQGAGLLTAVAGVIACVGAARWVSYAFLPARLLFLLPFFLAIFTRRTWIALTLAALSLVSLSSYYRGQDFLNKGYLLPFDRLADIIAEDGRPARLIVAAPGLDVSPLTRHFRQDPAAGIVWELSNRGRRPLPPGARELRHFEFVPYSELDRAMMRMLRWPVQPAYVLDLTEYQTH